MESKKDVAILILAGKVNLPDYNFESNEYLFNIGNSLAIEKIIKKLTPKSYTKIYVAISKLNLKFKDFQPFKSIEFLEVGYTNSILESIEKAIKNIPQKVISIIPITTIPDLPDIENNSCYFGSKSIPKENWSAIQIIENNKLNFFFKDDSSSYGLMSRPCTGRLVAEKTHLKKSISEIEEKYKSDILYLFKILIKKYKYRIIFEKWFDIGHETTYMDTKLSSMTSRFFNNIIYKESSNLIEKSSKDIEKIKWEFYYYSKLPKNLKNLFPVVYSHYNSGDDFRSIEMEFLPFPNLAEIFLFKNIGPNAWIRIIKSISNIYNKFYIDENYKIESNSSWLYSTKLLDRFQKTINFIENSNNGTLKKLLKEKININNKFVFEGLYILVNKLTNYLISYEKSTKQYIGHGDLCFNNILVDKISGGIKLIDPKAFFSNETNYIGLVDPNYDLAKLNHSYKYLYDSVVNNLFSIKIDLNNINLQVYRPYEYNLVNKLFNQILIKNRVDEECLRIITASLFISMLPLHTDDEERMICFAILGSIAFNNYDLSEIVVNI